jgi:saccharopine dehydrogenase-like NADP-dependent oxidoreductase
MFTLHSELATFPDSFPDLRDASFRLSLAPALAERVELLARCGLADLEPLALPDGTRVVPRQVLLAALARSRGVAPPSSGTIAVRIVDAIGRRRRDAAAVRAVAVTVPHDRWGLGGGVVSTAAPAAEAARRLLRGDVARAGVLPPEEAFVAERFLESLHRTGCTVTLSEVAAAG